MDARLGAFTHPLVIAFVTAMCSGSAVAKAQSLYTTLHHFQGGPGGVKGRLVQAADGNIYGTASEGGRYSRGLIYVIRRADDGTWLPPATFHDFQPLEGIRPLAGLTESAPGILWGTTSEGGIHGGGTIFRIAVTGQFEVVKSLNPTTDGAMPKAELTRADGSFYGSASAGGASDNGTIFRITASGVFTRLRSLNGADGRQPAGAMTVGPDGNLYGTTMFGGEHARGTAFRMTPAGALTTLRSFGGAAFGMLYNPAGPLTFAWDGALYGMTTGAWAPAPDLCCIPGAVYRMTTSGVVTNVNGNASNGLILHTDGWLYGKGDTQFFRIWPAPYTFEFLPNMPPDGGPSGIGAGVTGVLLPGSDGRLYGASARSGAHGRGAFFSIDASGQTQTVHPFGNDGVVPTGSLLRSADGNLYGTTYAGGLQGTLFRVSAGDTVSRIADLIGHSFDDHFFGAPTELLNGHLLAAGRSDMVEVLKTGETIQWNGAGNSGFVETPDGSIYGTWSQGDPGEEFGSIRLYGPNTFDLVYAFDASQGNRPLAGLMLASDSGMYGTTSVGGAFGFGTVFRFDLGAGLTTLHDFNGVDGSVATARLIEGPDGFLYGTTLFGGDTTLLPQGGGTIFKIGKDGTGFAVLHRFTGADGLLPFAELTLGSDGLFYGTAYAGGLGTGTVFVLNGDGAFAVLHRFGPGEGAYPLGGVTEWNGGLYGTTAFGGEGNVGVLYRIGGNP